MHSTSSSRDVAQFYLPLPVELFREIITYAAYIGTLATLARVSKTFHNLVMPILYRSIHLWFEDDAESFITCIKAAHASSVDNAKYIVVLFFEPDTMTYFDDVMSLPGINPQTLFFEADDSMDNVDDVVSSWEACPKGIGMLKDSSLSSNNSWLYQRMALFSHLTHLCLEGVLDNDTVSFCLNLRTLTHLCLPICRDLDSEVVLRQIHCLLGMPSMELLLIHAVLTEDDSEIDPDTCKGELNDMGFPKGDLFLLLAEIPDERLYVCPEMDMYHWFTEGMTPWDLGRKHLMMPWRKAVKAR